MASHGNLTLLLILFFNPHPAFALDGIIWGRGTNQRPPPPNMAVSCRVRGQVLKIVREKQESLWELSCNHQIMKLAARPHGHLLRPNTPWNSESHNLPPCQGALDIVRNQRRRRGNLKCFTYKVVWTVVDNWDSRETAPIQGMSRSQSLRSGASPEGSGSSIWTAVVVWKRMAPIAHTWMPSPPLVGLFGEN